MMQHSLKMEEIRFGYWPRKIELRTRRAVIRAVGNYDDIVESMEQNERVLNGWLYPPLTVEGERGTSPERRTVIYERKYRVDSTHCLSLPRTSSSRTLGEFLIALLGMLEGLRLVPEGWFHFYRAAVKRHSLSDIDCDHKDLEGVLAAAQGFWKRASREVRSLMFGAVHRRMLSESYEHEFERFSGQYIVLDTCWKIAGLLDPHWLQRYVHSGKIPKWTQRLAGRRRTPRPGTHFGRRCWQNSIGCAFLHGPEFATAGHVVLLSFETG